MDSDEIEPVSSGDPTGASLSDVTVGDLPELMPGRRLQTPRAAQGLGSASDVTAIAAAIIASSSAHSVVLTVIVAISVLLAAFVPE